MDFLFLFIGLLAGGTIGFLIAKQRSGFSKSGGSDIGLEAKVRELEIENQVKADRLQNSIKVFEDQKEMLKTEREHVLNLERDVASWEANYKSLKERLNNQTEELENIQQKFTKEFENIANKILEEKSTRFTEQNRKNMDEVLKPLKENLTEFKTKVEETYVKGTQERSALGKEIKMLTELNQRMSEDAQNLTKALKGDNKQQGNWGEMILEKVLENSGLTKGQEYITQFHTQNEDGRRIQPDVIINLPDEKHIIIDAKVSLLHYDAYVNASEELERESALRGHLLSLKTHVKHLAEKSYHTASGISSPDFVLMFVPIEASFAVAIQKDLELFNYAWEQKIVIVSPTTLLATLRTISSIWKQEKQTRNAVIIAQEGGKLYNKFAGFLEDMEKIKRGMDTSRNAYDEAIKKINGKGGLISKTQKLHELGVKINKAIPQSFNGEEEETVSEEDSP